MSTSPSSTSASETAVVASVSSWGSPPKIEHRTLPPSPPENHIRVHVLATSVHQLVRLRAGGRHYSATALPHVPGVDGVGCVPAEGNRLVYFNALTGDDATTGSFRSIADIPRFMTVPFPLDISSVHVASMVNPTLSSWLAVRHALGPGILPKGFSVLVLGATSLSGKGAVAVLRKLGAGWVAGAARDEERLSKMGTDDKAPLDERVVLKPEGTDWSKVTNVDLVLDYLSGDPALSLLNALKPTEGKRTWWVQIGDMAGAELTLPSPLLRSKKVALCGSGIGVWDGKAVMQEMPEILVALADVPQQEVRVVKLEDVEKVWNSDGDRMVLVP